MNVVRIVSTVVSLVSLIGLLACEDEEFTTTVSGRVVNFGSGEPIEGVTVYLKDGVGTSGFGIEGGTSSDLRNETLTNENGEFTVSLTGSHSASLSMGKEGYRFDPDWNDGVSVGVRGYGRGGGVYQEQLFELKAEAGFSPTLQSTAPVGKTDTLTMYILDKNLKSSPSSYDVRRCIGETACHFYDGTYPYGVVGDQYVRYQLNYNRGGAQQTKIDSVYVKSFEIFTEVIYY